MRNRLLFLVCCFAGIVFASCTPQRVREAQVIVSQADSLKAVGAEYDDSLRLAEAAWVLASFPYRIVDADDYTRVCYHYGRLLRRHDNQVEAMRWFIKGTKACSNDHTTKGRMYSNMAGICHSAKKYQLSYQMYEKSAEEFEQANEMTMFYYALNSMAFEQSMQKKYNEVQSILNTIRQECLDTLVIAKTWETEAWMYMSKEQYDSTIYAVNKQQQLGNYDAIGYEFKASAFWALSQLDSALFYAKQVMEMSDANPDDKYTMLYILAYNDPSIDKEEMKELTDERADIHANKVVPLRTQSAVAVQVLQQSLSKKKYYIYLSLILLIICATTFIAWYARKVKKEKSEAEVFIKQVEKELAILYEKMQKGKQIQSELLQEQQQLQTANEQLRANNRELEQITDDLQTKLENLNRQQLYNKRIEIEQRCTAIVRSLDWKQEVDWKDYEKLCNFINFHFSNLADKLKTQANLNEQEIRLCILVLLNRTISNDDIAENINYSKSGIGKFKYRISKKIHIDTENIREYLISLTLSE